MSWEAASVVSVWRVVGDADKVVVVSAVRLDRDVERADVEIVSDNALVVLVGPVDEEELDRKAELVLVLELGVDDALGADCVCVTVMVVKLP